MILRTKIEVAIAAVVLFAGLFGFRIWLQEHDAGLQAKAELTAEKKAFDALSADRKSHDAADQARDAAATKQLEAMATAAAKVQTPAEIAAWIPKQIPGLPQPITITVPPATRENPTPDATASIPQADLPALRDAVEKCGESSVRLSACQADLSSRTAEMAIADKQIKALEAEVGTLQTEAKGGTFWKRAKKTLKVAACATAGGAGGSFAAKEKGAAIGAAAGALGCSLF